MLSVIIDFYYCLNRVFVKFSDNICRARPKVGEINNSTCLTTLSFSLLFSKTGYATGG